jgi:hypothetical protein
VLTNAGKIVLSLLYEQGHTDPFGRALSPAGMMGRDTDCNCGNIGTIMGTILGVGRLPKKWTEYELPFGYPHLPMALSGRETIIDSRQGSHRRWAQRNLPLFASDWEIAIKAGKGRLV